MNFVKIYQLHDYLEYLLSGYKIKTTVGVPTVNKGYSEKVVTKTRTVEHCTCESCPLKAVSLETGETYCTLDTSAGWDEWEEEFLRGEDYEEFCPNGDYSEWEEEEYEKIESVINDAINENSTAIFSIHYGTCSRNEFLIHIKSRFDVNGDEIFSVEKNRNTIFESSNDEEIVTFVTQLVKADCRI